MTINFGFSLDQRPHDNKLFFVLIFFWSSTQKMSSLAIISSES